MRENRRRKGILENTQGLEHMGSKTSYEHRNTWGHKTSREVAVQTRKGHTGTLSFNKQFLQSCLRLKLSCGTNWDKFDIVEQLHWLPTCLEGEMLCEHFPILCLLFSRCTLHMDGRQKSSARFEVSCQILYKIGTIPRARKAVEGRGGEWGMSS